MIFKRRYLFLLFPLAVLFAVLAFFLRTPLVMITDAPFENLYGQRRGRLRALELSARLFRQVKTVEIADNAGPDLVVFAVEEVSSRPWRVLFPYRYYEGALRYARRFPERAVAVLGGREEALFGGGEVVFISTDIESDYYRAGRAAAILAGEGNILFFQDFPVHPETAVSFRQGLREEGYGKEPILIWSFPDSVIPGVSCIVSTSILPFYGEKGPAAPLILFSWLDPALTPAEAVVIFDDSPWALALPALESLSRPGGGGSLPSDALVIKKQVLEKKIFQSIKKILQMPKK